jgi:hypothetical protein
VVDLTGDDNEEDDLLFQSGNDFFHIEEGIERARQVAAAVAMAALSDECKYCEVLSMVQYTVCY